MTARDPLNFFSPYDRLPAGHENQLTRALLLLLRMSPLAHTEWMRLIAPEHALPDLPPVEFDTQRRSVRVVETDADATELISVFLAPEVEQVVDDSIVESDREQVLDGIVDYGGDLIVVIENKVFEADDRQARELNLQGSGIEHAGQKLVRLPWRDLLDRLIRLRERGLAAGAEAAVLDDFLTYVEDHFENLGPFRTLALCQRVRGRLLRRLRAVLGDATGLSAESNAHGACVATPGQAAAIRDVYLRVTEEDNDVELALYPGDTLGQARAFYGRPTAVRGVKELAGREGWEARPNFHFGHMQRGFSWTTGDIQLDRYLDLWAERIGQAGSVHRSEWDGYWDWLIETRIARSEDRQEFDRHFTGTDRQTASPRPGLSLARRWTLEEAEQLDLRREFAASVRESLELALTTIGEPPLVASRMSQE